MNRKQKINWIVKVSVFAAKSTVLYCLRFTLQFFPSFLDVQFSNLPAILAGYIFGPLGGAIVIVIKTLLKLLIQPSHTAGVGELADLVIGLAVVIPSSIFYQKHKTKKGGIIALIIAGVCWVCGSVVANYFFLIDFYAAYLEGGMATLVKACEGVIPGINEENFKTLYVLYAALPFNLMLASVVLIVTFIVYKHLSKIFKNDFLK